MNGLFSTAVNKDKSLLHIEFQRNVSLWKHPVLQVSWTSLHIMFFFFSSTVNWAHKAHVPAGPFTCHLLYGQGRSTTLTAQLHVMAHRAKLGVLEATGSTKESLNKLIHTCKWFRRRAGTALFSTQNSWVLQPQDTKSTNMHQRSPVHSEDGNVQ